MAFTQAEEGALRLMITGQSDDDIKAQKIAAQERQLDEKKAILASEKAAVDAAYNSVVQALATWRAAIATRDAAVIQSAKDQYNANDAAYDVALQNAKSV